MQISVTVCFLAVLAVSVHTHVLGNFDKCSNFFYKGFEPKGLLPAHFAHICQLLENNYHFATLYDTSRRIPVYSAYVLETHEDGHDPYWSVEPQLTMPSCDMNMMTEKEVQLSKCQATIAEIKAHQAVDADYAGLADYDRGHLNPKGHHSGVARDATFTLTNAVPQNRELNQNAWADYENRIRGACPGNHMYVLVGAVPSANKWVEINKVRRVNIPDYMWHAYCCVDQNNRPVRSGAATANNAENKVVQCSLESLKGFFGKLNEKPSLFDNCNTDNNIEGDCSRVIH